MIRYLLQRLFVLSVRLILAGLGILLLIELAFGVLGGSDQHVWMMDFSQPPPEGFSSAASSWTNLFVDRMGKTSLVLLLCYGSALLIGYGWGILAARLRRFRAVWLLALPWSVLACLPGFWFVVVVAIYSFFEWQRPGFANDIVVETGPDLLGIWNAAVVALPVLGIAASWQLRAVSAVVEKNAGRPFVKALYLTGYHDEDIFYSNVLKRGAAELISLIDRTLPVILGSLICLEWAFRYDGFGSLLVDSIKAQSIPGIFLSSMWMITVIGIAATVREWFSHIAETK